MYLFSRGHVLIRATWILSLVTEPNPDFSVFIKRKAVVAKKKMQSGRGSSVVLEQKGGVRFFHLGVLSFYKSCGTHIRYAGLRTKSHFFLLRPFGVFLYFFRFSSPVWVRLCGLHPESNKAAVTIKRLALHSWCFLRHQQQWWLSQRFRFVRF